MTFFLRRDSMAARRFCSSLRARAAVKSFVFPLIGGGDVVEDAVIFDIENDGGSIVFVAASLLSRDVHVWSALPLFLSAIIAAAATRPFISFSPADALLSSDSLMVFSRLLDNCCCCCCSTY